MSKNRTFAVLSLALLFHSAAGAYEVEDAVPLTLAAALGKLSVERLAIRLTGRSVEIETSVRNSEATSQAVGFYAFTSFFERLGDGEEHADKTFSDLRIANGSDKLRRPASNQRGFFMGQDITSALAKAGVGPLPDKNVTEKALAKVRLPFGMRSLDWDGYVAYSWVDNVAPRTTRTSTVRYRALPHFGLDNISSNSFRQAVQQHCGDPAKIAREIMKSNDGSEDVMVERYELPIKFMKMQDVSVTVDQPASNWLGAHPVATLMCGLPNAETKATLSGTVNANMAISVLVISRLAVARERKGKARGDE